MKSIRFGLVVIAICGLIVLASGIRIAVWTQAAETIASDRDFIGNELSALRHTSEALVELESAERFYLLTGQASDLASFEAARGDLAAALKALDGSFADDPARAADIAETLRLGQDDTEDAARTVQLRAEGGQGAAVDAAIADHGRQIREAVRSKLHSIADRLRHARADLDGLRSQKFRDIYWLSAIAVVIVDLLVVVAIVSLSISIHWAREQEERQRAQAHLAMHDELTGLPNRRYLGEWLGISLAAARRSGRELALLYFDLDGFKSINDRFGHDAGDRVLQVTAQRWRSALRISDFFARLGGDEFVAVLPEVPTEPNLAMLIQRLQVAITKAPIPELADGAVCASIGVATFPRDGDAVDALLAAADHAMYEVKERRRAAAFGRRDVAENLRGPVRSTAT